jgi:RimJ/RimL family protein N-acetyltransferase
MEIPMVAGIQLRPITEADLCDYVRWFNDPEVTQFTSMESGEHSLEAEKQWLARMTIEYPKRHLFAIEADGRHIGNCELCPEHERPVADIGIVIGDKSVWDRGYGTLVVKELLRIGFEEEKLHRIYLDCFAENTRAIRCYTKCGFRPEGVQRQSELKRGRWCDMARMAILAEDWQNKTAVTANAVEALAAKLQPERVPICPEALRPGVELWPVRREHIMTLANWWGWSQEKIATWFADISRPNSPSPHWVIAADGRMVGNCVLVPKDDKGTGMIFALGIASDANKSRGIGTAAVWQVLRYGFESMQMRRIFLDVQCDNARAIACYEKCGFRREMIERQSRHSNNVWQDYMRMAILKEEWKAL